MTRTDFEAALRREGCAPPAEVSLAPGRAPRAAHARFRRARPGPARRALPARNGGEERYRPGEMFVVERGCEHFEHAGAEGAAYLAGRRG